MRRICALFAIALSVSLPAKAAQLVTVERLERILTESQGLPDNELANRLSELRLTERLTSARLRGPKGRYSGSRTGRPSLIRRRRRYPRPHRRMSPNSAGSWD